MKYIWNSTKAPVHIPLCLTLETSLPLQGRLINVRDWSWMLCGSPPGTSANVCRAYRNSSQCPAGHHRSRASEPRSPARTVGTVRTGVGETPPACRELHSAQAEVSSVFEKEPLCSCLPVLIHSTCNDEKRHTRRRRCQLSRNDSLFTHQQSSPPLGFSGLQWIFVTVQAIPRGPSVSVKALPDTRPPLQSLTQS